MTSLAAWLLFPLLAYAVAAGLGLLLGRVTATPVRPDLLAPVGLCLAVVIVLPVYKLGGTVWLAAPLLAILALAGFALTRGGRRERLKPGWPLAAALAVYALYMAPVVLSGHWTWLGYNFVNDTAVNLVLTDHVAEHGVRIVEGPASTTKAVIDGTLAARYPMGLHALLATLHGIIGFIPLEAVYQPFIALLAAMAAMALAGLATRIGVPGPLGAAVGGVAAGANLTYQYAGHGAFKEVALVLVVAASAAQSRVLLDERLRLGAVAQLGVIFAAGIVIFSTAAGAYAGASALILLVAALAAPWRPRLVTLSRVAAVGAAVLFVAALPGLNDALAYARGASEFYAAEGGLAGPNSVAFLGHLLQPLPLREAAGFWPDRDYRLPVAGLRGTATWLFAGLAVVLIAVTAAVEVSRRRLGGLLLLVPCAAVYAVAAPRLGPYAEAKLLVILAPAVVFAAGLGAYYAARRLPVAGIAAGAVLALGVLYSDALAYHGARLAPVDRLEALREAAEHAPERGLVLLPEWEEWAKYFARARQNNVGPESFSPRSLALREYFPFFGHSIDLDQVQLPYLQGFAAVILRNGPTVSRPPADFRLVHRNEFYAVWRRDPRVTVLDHLPLSHGIDAAAEPACKDIRALARRTRAGSVLVGAPRDPVPRLDYAGRPPLGWNPGPAPGTVVPRQPGRVTGRVQVDGGRHRVWVRGSSGRALEVSVDGRTLSRPEGVNTPEQWLSAGEIELSLGVHEVALVRPGGSPAPGDGYAGELGPVALEPVARPRLVRVEPEDAEATLCGRSWDWVERVRF